MTSLVRKYRRGRLAWLALDMLERRGVRHGFTLRYGGVSRGKFASLNFTSRQGDGEERVRENGRRLEEAAGLAAGGWALVSQVHGAEVVERRRGSSFCPHRNSRPAADAVITGSAAVTPAVLTADCLPVVIASPLSGVAGVAHAGWMGTVSGIVVRTVEAIIARGGGPVTEIVAGLGPSIGKCCYQVGEDLHLAFREKWGSGFAQSVFTRAEPWMLDLQQANRLQLIEAGVPPENIAGVPLCTACRPDLFFSHRRDGVRSGRMLNFASNAAGGPPAPKGRPLSDIMDGAAPFQYKSEKKEGWEG
jgi:YfiH family protein